MVLIRVFSTALVACLVARVAGAQAELSEAERLEFANGLFARGMYELAAAEYEAFLRDVPGSGSEDVVRFRLGESLRELGRVERAAEEFRRVFEKYPGSAYRFKAGFKAALLLREGGKYKEASEMLDRLLKAGPPEDTAAACQYELGEVWFSLGKPDESAKVFEELLKKHPNAELVPYAALRLGQFAAERALKSAADHGTSPPAAEMDRVAAYYKIALANGKTERVKAEALFQLADFYFRSGQYKQSFEYYRQLARDHASDFRTAESALQAAWAAYRAGLAVETLAIASRVLKEESSGSAEEEWLYLKANAERELGQFDAAVET
ncbi:MAG: tetratricopeptide repeat protein [Kiritimatiellae bacterium]|nr:tetratricopeptide repeat protein [Kiritimatiellia bacterium]